MPSSLEFQLGQAIEVLSATPEVLASQLGNLSRSWICNRYGEDTFSPYDVVRHLIHGERVDWIPRLRIILEHGERRPFDPFDIRGLYDEGEDESIFELVGKFSRLRAENLGELESMQLADDRLLLRGIHPELGSVTAAELIATWVAHDLNHIHQIVKCLAYQYREALGPWRSYVTFIDR